MFAESGQGWGERGQEQERGEEVVATVGREGEKEGGTRLRRRPGPGPAEEQAGAGRFARRKRGCRGGSRGQEGGRGGGWPSAEAWGGGRWQAGGRVSNCKHPHGRRWPGVLYLEMLKGQQAAGKDPDRGVPGGTAGAMGGAPTHLPPLLSSQGSVVGPQYRGLRVNSHQLLGLGT